MPRHLTPLGEHGSISLSPLVYDGTGRLVVAKNGEKPVKWRAKTRVRDSDGKSRPVQRDATTKAKAEAMVKAALRERSAPSTPGALVKPGTLVKDVAEVFRIQLWEGDRAPNTKTQYDSVLNRHIVGSSLANLAVREVKVSSVETWLTTIAHKSPSAAKMARSVLRSVLQLAVKSDAISLNPVRAADSIRMPRKSTKTDTNRALTFDDVRALIRYADTDPRSVSRDMGDLVHFLAATGARIGEACALRWSDVNLSAASATFRGTVVRIKGEGLVIQDGGKTEASVRTVRLPDDLVSRLRARKLASPPNAWGVVFTSAAGQLRDVSNTTKHFRALLDETAFPWAQGSHVFRKTVVTLLDQAGTSGRGSANQLGHKKASMTTDNYMSHRTITEEAAQVLVFS